MKLHWLCPECGSTDVRLDGWFGWNIYTQKWEPGDSYDAMACGDCGYTGMCFDKHMLQAEIVETSDQPTTCGKCGARTEFQQFNQSYGENGSTTFRQLHECRCGNCFLTEDSAL